MTQLLRNELRILTRAFVAQHGTEPNFGRKSTKGCPVELFLVLGGGGRLLPPGPQPSPDLAEHGCLPGPGMPQSTAGLLKEPVRGSLVLTRFHKVWIIN